MSKINIPKSLPDCYLVQLLAKKAAERKDTDFLFLARLDDFRNKVAAEIRQINELFPEYVPHDEHYHLKRLFHIADTILGRNALELMNSTELFVLAVALYGHDWGMAISNPEKKYIINGNLLKDTEKDDLRLLSDEHNRFVSFANRQRLASDAKSTSRSVPMEVWRQYVRDTHAHRSAERVRRFFEHIDRGVADAASRVCVSHWKNLENLQDHHLYPADFAVLHETINLRALAVYLRLIDLFDLAEDRTPYVIWKFVAPTDPRSKMEWAKHRALNPVTCPDYQEGRIIRVDGSTDDHEVYAALEDLRIYCNHQLRGCTDILARMNDPRHKLDLYHVDWRVAAREFRPISIQFQFDRERMFEVLSTEIYQGDRYVFLRELLQNSIDAIRMRREILKKKGLPIGDLGEIRVTVDHMSNGDAVVEWQDNGIGMDEFVVRNFLAVAGKSYYQSQEFQRQGLKMDPISRFGVGILSCSIVAERVEIETFKDPYLPPESDPLIIVIPDMQRQFRIEVRPREGSKIGTTVRVFVKGKKISEAGNRQAITSLDVTSYVSRVAAFVEFPIIIKENGQKTIVLHPGQDPEKARDRFDHNWQVQQIDLSYPWSEALLAQDVASAKRSFREERVDIVDLDLPGYEGTLIYLVPAKSQIDILNGEVAIIGGETDGSGAQIRPSHKWKSYNAKVGISRSGRHDCRSAIYRDGILLSEVRPPWWISDIESPLPGPKLVVNIPKSKSPRLDLSRTELQKEGLQWDLPILEAHVQQKAKCLTKRLRGADPTKVFRELGRLSAFHLVNKEQLWRFFPHTHWPILVMETGGHLKILEWQEVKKGNRLREFPQGLDIHQEVLENEIAELIDDYFLPKSKYTGILSKWLGGRCVILPYTHLRYEVPRGIYVGLGLGLIPINESYHSAGISFVYAWQDYAPLYQEVLQAGQPNQEYLDIEAVLEKALSDPTLLSSRETVLLNLESKFHGHIREFFPPFEKSFAYGWKVFNIKHPITQDLIRMAAAIKLADKHGTLPKSEIGNLEDMVDAISENLRFGSFPAEKMFKRKLTAIRRLYLLARKIPLLKTKEIRGLLPKPEDFVPGTFSSKRKVKPRHPSAFVSFGKPME